jgi:hypothetical protein
MVPDPNGSLQSRIAIWRQGIPLIVDYAFSGAGLAAFPITFSIYRLLIHVPFHEHMHNILLEVWFEQGILGAAALAWIGLVVAGWAWRSLPPPEDAPEGYRQLLPLGYAGLAALVAMGMHGMVDVVFYGKVSTPLVGAALGMAWRADPRSWLGEQRSAGGEADRGRRRVLILASSGVICALAAVLWGRQALALGFANLGALGQTRLEMAAYDPDHYDAPQLDEIRRKADQAWVKGAFRRALEIYPAQRTALQRLAQIELSRGEYDQALAHAEAAWQAGYCDDVTRLLYGDALAAAGDVDEAVAVVSGIDQAAGRLLFQGWYRYWLAGDYQRAADTLQAALLLEPGSDQARSLLEQARAVLAEDR